MSKDYRRTAKRRIKKRFPIKAFIVLTIVLLLLLLLITSPLFDVTEVTVTGANQLSVAEVKKMAELDSKKNIFLVNSFVIEKTLTDNPYVKSVKISKIFPREVHISIVERKVRGFVLTKVGAFLHVDEEGMVMNVTTSINDNLPIISGLDFLDFSVGNKLNVSNPKSFEVVVQLTRIFEKYDMTDILKLDVTDVKDIHIYVNGIDVVVGSVENADEKIQNAKYILETIPKEDTGVLNVSDITMDPVFQYSN